MVWNGYWTSEHHGKSNDQDRIGEGSRAECSAWALDWTRGSFDKSDGTCGTLWIYEQSRDIIISDLRATLVHVLTRVAKVPTVGKEPG